MGNKEICPKEEHLHYCYHCYHFAVICSVQARTSRILAASSPALLEPCWHVNTAKLDCWEGIPQRWAPPLPVLYLAHSKYPLNSSSLLREGLSRWLSGNESACQCRRCKRLGFTPGLGRSPGEDMETYSSIPAWKKPWTEEPAGLQSIGPQGVRHNEVTDRQQTDRNLACNRWKQQTVWCNQREWERMLEDAIKPWRSSHLPVTCLYSWGELPTCM